MNVTSGGGWRYAAFIFFLLGSPSASYGQEPWQARLFEVTLALQPNEYRSSLWQVRSRDNHLTIEVNENWEFIPSMTKKEFVEKAAEVFFAAGRVRGLVHDKGHIQVTVIGHHTKKVLATWSAPEGARTF